MLKNIIFIPLIALLLTGCPSMSKQTTSDEPEMVQLLPKAFGGYEYRAYHVYPDKALGVSFRYVKQGEAYHHADIYLYPVPASAEKEEQQKIVMVYTRAAEHDIFEAGRLGYYSNVEARGEDNLDLQGDLLTRSQYVFIRNNLKVYSLLYLTEYHGSLIKARISLPFDNNSLKYDETDAFVRQVFKTIKQQL